MFSDQITITIPVYERFDFFEEALNSALNQTIKCRVIVSDNASAHRKFEDLVTEKAVFYNELQYSKNATNIGMFGNWNKCAELVKTPYLVILGDDDILDVRYIERILQTIASQPVNSICATSVSRFTTHVPDYNSEKEFKELKLQRITGVELLQSITKKGLWWPTQSTCYPTSLLLSEPFRNPSNKRHSSADWYWVHKKAETFNFCIFDEPLYKIRSHVGNSGIPNKIYVALTQSEIYWKAGSALEKNNHFKDAKSAVGLSGICVLNANILNPALFYKTVKDCIDDNDPFVKFIENTWVPHSYIIRSLIFGKNALVLKPIWLLCRIARFFSRLNPEIFKYLTTMSFKNSTLKQMLLAEEGN